MAKNDAVDIKRINELAKRKKQGLTESESKEQSKLRKAYLDSFRKSFKNKLKVQELLIPRAMM